MVILEQLKTLDKRRIIRYMGRVDSNILYSPEFCKCLAVSLALSCNMQALSVSAERSRP